MTRWLVAFMLSSCGRTELPDAFLVETPGRDAGTVDAGRPQVLTIFAASFDAGAWDLFSTEGTARTTQRLGFINRQSSIPPPGASFERRHYFSCSLPSVGFELCVTDGTPGGTGLFKDLTPGPNSSAASNFMVGGGRLAFVSPSTTLWESDGTADGTVRVLTARAPLRLLESDERGVTLWADGELVRVRQGVRTVLGAAQEVITGATLDSVFYFVGSDAQHGRELWRTTGTGVERVTDLNPGPPSSVADFDFVVAGGRLYFQAQVATQTWLFRIGPGAAPQQVSRAAWGMPMTAFENDCVFFFEGRLWRANESGVRSVVEIENVSTPLVVAGRLHFQARIGGEFAVWRLEGDVPRKLQTFSEQPLGLAESGGALYLRGATASAGREVWVFKDGVPSLIDVNPGSGSSFPWGFRPLAR